MRILEIREDVAPIASSIRNAFIDFSTMTASIVAIVTDQKRDGRPVIGFGFNSNGRYAPQGLLRERFIPRLREFGEADPVPAWTAMMRNEKPGGHGERSVAVGVLDMALWDALAKAEGVPLWRLLADRYRNGKAEPDAWVYAAGGYYYPGDDTKSLSEELKRYLDLGYDTVKMKIGGANLATDLRRIEAALGVVVEGRRLCVDVNGRFDLTEALEYAAAIEPLGLRWYEEPLDPLDYATHETLAQRYSGAIATGENLFSMQDARNLIRHAGLRAVATCCNSILRFLTDWSNICVRSRCSKRTAGRARVAYRTADINSRSILPLDSAWEATNRIRKCSRRSAALRIIIPFGADASSYPIVPESVSKKNASFMRC